MGTKYLNTLFKQAIRGTGETNHLPKLGTIQDCSVATRACRQRENAVIAKRELPQHL